MPSLLDPLTVKGLVIPNRIVFPPIQTRLSTVEGIITDNLIEHYVQRAKHLGMLILEHGYVSQQGRLGLNELGIHDDSVLRKLEQLVRRIHDLGMPLILQLNHAGAVSRIEVTGTPSVAPSPLRSAREMSRREIDLVIEDFALSAGRAMRAGFDGVELHGAHGFLLNQFFSPLTNARKDLYGGSLENRMRFGLDVVDQVKSRIGDRLLLYRLGADDLDPAGTRIEEAQQFAQKLVAAGVDILDVSGGICGSRPSQLQDVPGYFIPQAREIKQIVPVPIIGVGGITDPHYANLLVQDTSVDLVAVGRALLHDPGWATKAVQILSRS